ncbi:competence type IV pilus minor pilin ComGF [Cytobacillus sp. FJAT-54145]|uniref:Competence type IV pilus minor pilin ComGF n=1 Tax=Cytobacillus spartinae TaxID=3299023 RepID=A0ABW6KE11_9BACI
MLNSKGFTMLEMLFSFSIFCLVSSFIPITFQLVLDHDSVHTRIQKMEWEVFVYQLSKEIQMSEHTNISNNKLELSIGGETISYEKYGSNIRRLVDYRGHEIVLQNVKGSQFNQTGQTIHINVMDTFNQSHEVNIFTYISSVVIE